jgi:hypothetical protein
VVTSEVEDPLASESFELAMIEAPMVPSAAITATTTATTACVEWLLS